MRTITYKETRRPRTHTEGVYGLVDPREPGRVRYIGTSTSIEKRLRQHVQARPKYPDGPKAPWLKSLRDAGVEPVAVVLEQVHLGGTQSEVRHAAERRWVLAYRLVGEADLNAQLVKSAWNYKSMSLYSENGKRKSLHTTCNTTRNTSNVLLCGGPTTRNATHGGLEDPVLCCAGPAVSCTEQENFSKLDRLPLADFRSAIFGMLGVL